MNTAVLAEILSSTSRREIKGEEYDLFLFPELLPLSTSSSLGHWQNRDLQLLNSHWHTL
jgi:hypothetical protein